MSIALEPRLHAVRVRRLAKSSDVRVRDFVRDKPPEVPEESVRIRAAAHGHAVQDGEIRRRIIAERRLELLREAVGEVLSALLVAVEDGVAYRLAAFRRRGLENLAEVGVKVRGDVLAAHLVHLVSRRLGIGRTVLRSGRGARDAVDRPCSGGNLPVELAVGRDLARQHDGLRRIERRLFGTFHFNRPFVFFPHRKRRLVHLAERLLDGALDVRRGAYGDGRETGGRVSARRRYGHAKPLCGRRRKRGEYRRVRREADARPVVVAAVRHFADAFPRAAGLGLHDDIAAALSACKNNLRRLRLKRLG